jgi:uncharacterized protein
MPTLVGLAIAWGGIALLISPASRLLGDPQRLPAQILGQIALWSLFGAILIIVVRWERQPLASMWLQPFQWSSIGWGLVYVAFAMIVVMPAREWVRRALGLPGFAAGMDKILGLPIWFRFFLAITAGIVEDALFLGFTLTRLASATRSLWIAAAITVVATAAVHIPAWGIGPSVSFLVGGVPTVAFFIWRRDLLTMMVAHAVIDAIGIAITPLVSAWWLDQRFS